MRVRLREANTGAIFLVQDQQVRSRTKNIDVQYHYLREMREQGEVDVLLTQNHRTTFSDVAPHPTLNGA
jgi:hypothetical protein